MAVIITPIFSLITLLLSINLLPSSSTLTSMASENCINELVSFSPCLPYTASPPNNYSSLSDNCCYNYNQILISGRGFCLCFLLLQPPVFGAPLDSAKIHSLSSVCPTPRHTNFGSLTNFSLHSLCSDFEVSPPPQSAGPESGINTSTEQFSYSPTNLSPSPEMDLTPTWATSADSLQSPPPGLHLSSSHASAATKISSITPLPIILSGLHIMLNAARWG